MMRRGSVAVELALLLPVLLVLLVGALEWGRVLEAQVAIVQVARDGALAGARAGADGDPAGVAEARARAGLAALGRDAGAAEVVVAAMPLSVGDAIQVTITTPYAGGSTLVPVPAQLSAAVTARLEGS